MKRLSLGLLPFAVACTAGKVTTGTDGGLPVADTLVTFISCDPSQRIAPVRTAADGTFAANPYDPNNATFHNDRYVSSGDVLIATFDPANPSTVRTQYANHVYDQTCTVQYNGAQQSEPCKWYQLNLTSMAADDAECGKFRAACSAKGFAPIFCPADFYKMPAVTTGSGATCSVGSSCGFGEVCIGGRCTVTKATVGAPAQIAGNQYGEAVIAIHPQNGDNAVAVGIDTARPSTGGAYYTVDGGKTWASAVVNGQAGTKFGTNPDMAFVDPNVDIDTHGNVYIIAWTKNDAFPGQTGMILYKSTDAGRTYNPAAAVATEALDTAGTLLMKDVAGNLVHLVDGPHLRIDKRADVYPNPIYVEFAAETYASMADFAAKKVVDRGTIVARSADGGKTFTLRMQHVHGNGSVGPSGEVYDLAPPYLYVSTDGAQSYIARTAFAQAATDDYGWGNWGWVGFVADSWSTSPNKGALYSAYGDGARDGGDILFRRSLDGGNTWSPAIRLNDDAPTTLCNGKVPQYLPNINVAPNGRIDVVWYDRRNDPYASNCNAADSSHLADVYYAYSLDGGAHFSANIRLTRQPTSSAGDYIWVSSGATRALAVYSQYNPGIAPYLTLGRTLFSSTIDFSR